MAEVDFDLFGDPVRPQREGPGRPEHVWTLENSHKVNLLFAVGGDVRDAARVLGISVPTLRKHYFAEVDQRRLATLKLKVRQLQLLAAAAEEQNVAAIKELFKRLDKSELAALAVKVADRGKAEPKPPRLGKKAQQKEAAGKVGGKFAPPPAPLLN